VIVWIYGGGFIMGDSLHVAAGLGKLYDPTNIVERHGHVFVSMNYRLSGFGFMALPELAEESPTGTTGNYGLQDQRAAMQWVQRNIRNFGGDPSKVTIQGESAGAMSVMFHLVSPASQGLFHGAIEESGTLAQGCFFQNRSDSFKFNRQWAAIKGCTSTGSELLSCLRKLPASDFMIGAAQMVKDWTARLTHSTLPSDIPDWACALFPTNAWGAVVDGSTDGLPDWPLKLLEEGKFNKVPLISGANVNGGFMFGWLFPLLWGDLPYPVQQTKLTKVAEWFLPDPSDRTKFLELYGGPDWHTDPYDDIDRISRFWRDSFFLCPARETALQWSAHGQPVYEYVFSFYMHTNVSSIIHGIDSTHAFELPFVFRNWVESLGKIFGKDRWEAMSDVMSCTWASFVRCQKPKCPADPPPNCAAVLEHVPEWPAFSPTERKYISLKANTTIETLKSHETFPHDEYPGDDRCDFWKKANLGWQSIRTWPGRAQNVSISPEIIKKMQAKMMEYLQSKWITQPDDIITV
jgi:para-nitrobenzyl esterase